MAHRSRLQRFLIMVIVGLAMVGVLALVIYSFAGETNATSGGAQPSAEEDAARRALAPARALATQWQPDAQLAGVTGQQLDVHAPSTLDIAWAFQFYSPATQRLALVTVAGGEAKMARPPALSPYAVETFSSERWQVGSDRALDVWLSQGGRSMMAQHRKIDLMMQLRVSEDDQLVWMVTGIAVKTNTSYTLLVDAVDGAVSRP